LLTAEASAELLRQAHYCASKAPFLSLRLSLSLSPEFLRHASFRFDDIFASISRQLKYAIVTYVLRQFLFTLISFIFHMIFHFSYDTEAI
jgi:hypothetical protein